MPEFFRDKTCKRCDLFATCKSVCLPMRWFGDGPCPSEPAQRRPRALLVVGKAPGYSEDQDGQSWVGPPGQMLSRLYVREAFGFHKRCDVYVTNVIRCRLPNDDDKPTEKQLRACRIYLDSDLAWLQEHYVEVWILAVGAPAAAAFGHKSLAQAFHHQGEEYVQLTTIQPKEKPMGKGDHRRPCAIPVADFDKKYEEVFGKKKLNNMSDEDREALEQELGKEPVNDGANQ